VQNSNGAKNFGVISNKENNRERYLFLAAPAGSIVGALYHKLKAQSSAPEDGRNYRPKHVKPSEIVNKIIIIATSCLFVLFYRLTFTCISHFLYSC